MKTPAVRGVVKGGWREPEAAPPGWEGDFSLPPEGSADPRPTVIELVNTLPEFHHLKHGECVIAGLMRNNELVKNGRRVLGEMRLPTFQGGNARLSAWLLEGFLGQWPDFLLILETDWWSEATPIQREALIYHELMHCGHAVDKNGDLRFDDNGRPVYCIRGHDVEEFNAVVKRYGLWSPDLRAMADAMREAGTNV